VRIWDVASGKTIATLGGYTASAYRVAVSPDGRTLAAGTIEKTVRLWDLAGGKAVATLSGHKEQVYSVAFSPDGRTLASGSADNTVRVWNVASGKSRLRQSAASCQMVSSCMTCWAMSGNGRRTAGARKQMLARPLRLPPRKRLVQFERSGEGHFLLREKGCVRQQDPDIRLNALRKILE
jgi:WD40 repeat protein